MKRDTTSKEFFDGKYQQDPDPWSFASNPYELNRFDATLRMLSHRRYGRAFEPGCSIGVLTARLASICDEIYSIDISPTAVMQARNRCRHLPNVTIGCGALPGDIPAEVFDLIVFSEIGYYFSEEALTKIVEELVKDLKKPGFFMAAHWLGTSEDHVLTGNRVHEILDAAAGLEHQRSERHEGFRMDLWAA